MGQVLISVSDTSVGLPPQQADKVFDAFLRAADSSHSSGLNLAHNSLTEMG
jgi:signal transduction histidine kinase